MRAIVLFFRFVVIGWVFFVSLFRYLARRLGGRGRTVDDRDRLRGEILASAFERLGATFVKFGQILGTRPDVLPQGMIVALSRLQDAVPPAPFAEVQRVLEEDLDAKARARFASIEEVPVAAASVAQVHRGVLDDGRVVAIKVQRLRAAPQIERDLALLGLAARMLSLFPGMRYMSLPGAAKEFDHALRAQLDFELEAKNNLRLAKNFANEPKIHVPKLIDGLCTRRVLTMEFIDGVRPTDVTTHRQELAQMGFRCIAQMVFLDGFVHADMHPGNILFTKDGHVYLIDLGLVAEIPEDQRKPWIDTFVSVASFDGKRTAALFYTYAPEQHVRDYAQYEADIVAHLASFVGRPLHELEVTQSVGGAMAILRKHRVKVDPSFTVVNLAMLVAEGVGKQLDPHFDVYACAMPYLIEASARYPTGRPPLRSVPRVA